MVPPPSFDAEYVTAQDLLATTSYLVRSHHIIAIPPLNYHIRMEEAHVRPFHTSPIRVCRRRRPRPGTRCRWDMRRQLSRPRGMMAQDTIQPLTRPASDQLRIPTAHMPHWSLIWTRCLMPPSKRAPSFRLLYVACSNIRISMTMCAAAICAEAAGIAAQTAGNSCKWAFWPHLHGIVQ